MERKTKVKLIEDDLTVLGAMITCCNVRQWIPNEFEPGEHWNCEYCDTPLIFRARNGLWYHVGGKVFD